MSRHFFRRIFLVLVTALFVGVAEAGCEIDVSDYVGWQIIYSGTVTGYIDEEGREVDGFEGCEYGRVLIIDYSKSVKCAEYNYDYAYRPDIVILSSGNNFVACIDDEVFDVQR